MLTARMAGRIEIVRGDITEQVVDAIVNAANETLLGGGGVDGAIHRAGGPEILAECRAARRLRHRRRQGDDRRAPARALRDPHGRARSGAAASRGEPELLASCHRRSLELAAVLGCRTVAFPAISTGVYGYPVELAAEVAIAATRAALKELREIELVRFVLFGEAAETAFAAALSATA